MRPRFALLCTALLVLLACGGDVTAPPGGDVVVDRYTSGTWSYRYTNKSQGYTVGLDSVSGRLTLSLGRESPTAAVAAVTVPVVGYFWAVTIGGTDTSRGVQPIWPAGGVTRGEYQLSGDTLRLVNMRPPTFLDVPDARFVAAGDSLTYGWAYDNDVETLALIIPFLLQPDS